MPCHSTKELKELEPSRRKDRNERRFICVRCGQHWQYTDHWYQVNKPKGNGRKKQRAVMMYDDMFEMVKKDYDGLQSYLEYCLRRDGYK